MFPQKVARSSKTLSKHGVITGSIIVLLVTLLVACSTPTSEGSPTVKVSRTGVPVESPTPVRIASTPELQVLRLLVAVSDLGVGPGNRLAFALIGQDGPVKVPTAAVKLTFLGGEGGRPSQVAAVFRSWPAGPGGVYVALVEFDKAGEWSIEARVFLPGATIGLGNTKVSVATASASPAIGSKPPASRNKVVSDLDDPTNLSSISSASDPDPDLYQLTIAEAVNNGRPSVVSFATPAFCQTEMCGPQIEVLTAIKERTPDQVNFIHVEVYEDPSAISDISRARLVPQMAEWGLRSEPFTFILDNQGRVFAKFEGFVNEQELRAALQSLLDS